MSVILTFMAVFMMWLMWISVFLHQKHPLMTPQIEEEVLKALESQKINNL